MKKDIVQVRKEIAKRKQSKLPSMPSNGNRPYKQNLANHITQDEEKHGYMSTFYPTADKSENESKFFSSVALKTSIAGILFFVIALGNQMDSNLLTKPKEWTTSALTEEFPFATVNQWYQQKFGSPFALTSQDQLASITDAPVLPVNGIISQPFQANDKGVWITTDKTSHVYAMEPGVVLFAGNDKETNKTIIIQHADKSKSIYGNLSDLKVNQYQFVNGNQVIGEFTPTDTNASKIYFAVKKDNQFLDPVKVIQVDESS